MDKSPDDVQGIEKIGEARDKIVAELRKAIVGMDDVIDEMMIAIFAQGHCLLVGVPGLAKTLLVSSLSETLSLSLWDDYIEDCRGRNPEMGFRGV